MTNVPPDGPRRLNASNGSIIALSYEARAAGVKRSMRGDEARRVCPEMQLVQVPTSHQKADLTIYREEGKAVIDVLARKIKVVERASIDEAYLDLSAEAAALLAARGLAACCAAAGGTNVAGVEDMPEARLSVSSLRRGHAGNGAAAAADADADNPDAVSLSAAWLAREEMHWTREEMLLVAGAALVRDLREDVRSALGFTCSAGIAANKLLAKLATGLRKPDAQTLLPRCATAALLALLPLQRLRGLGGAFGAQVQRDLNCTTVGELAALPLSRLQARLGEDRGLSVYRLARGESDEPVKARDIPASIGNGKTFRGALALRTTDALHTWLRELAAELEERLTEDRALNARTPRLLTAQLQPANAAGVSFSCACRAGAGAMADDAAALARRWATAQPQGWEVVGMSLKASNFQLDVHGMRSITDFLAPAADAQTAGAQAAPAQQQAPQPAQPAGLRRFFAAAAPPEAADGSAAGAGALVRCAVCGRESAAGRDAEEHSDWHFAQQLSRQEQRAAAPPAKRAKARGPLDALLQRAARK